MHTRPLTADRLAASVIAVPPLARRADLTLNSAENLRMIQHLEAGGVSTLLYGGNAALHHVRLGEYEQLLRQLEEGAASETLVIPSLGPGFGMAMEQAQILRNTPYTTAMLLPTRDATTPAGVVRGIRLLAEAAGKPLVLYIKHEGYVDVDGVRCLVEEKLISWVKYAIVRPDPAHDTFVRQLVDQIGGRLIVSGIGEQPAVTHLEQFGLVGFTSGCVCIAPALSMAMLAALQSQDHDEAEAIRRQFAPLEDLRNQIHPVRVLHAAVTACGIAEMGPIVPLLSEISDAQRAEVQSAAKRLMQGQSP